MNPVSYIKKVLTDDEDIYLVSLPDAVVDALKQRKRLTTQPYVHWMRLQHLYYAVTLGNTKGQNRNPLHEDNTTELPEKIVNEIKHEEEIANMDATAISWRITKWYGRTVAFAKILIGHDKTFAGKIVNNELKITPELKYFMNLHVRTKLYWKRLDEDTWLIAKYLKEYDGITWHVCDTLTFPPKFFEDMRYYIGWDVDLWLTTIDNTPVILLRRRVFRTPVQGFFEERIEKNGKEIEIHELFTNYLDYLKAHYLYEEPATDFDFFLDLLERADIISPELHAWIKENQQAPHYIHGYSLKTQTNERGDGNG